MNKTRLPALLLAIVMIVTLFVGCGEETNNETNITQSEATIQTSSVTEYKETGIEVDTSNKNYITSKDAFETKMKELLDISLYSEMITNEGTNSNSYTFSLKSEHQQEYDLDYTVKLGDGSEFTMPISFSELEKKGWMLQENSSPNREMGSNMMTWGNIENAAGKTLLVTAYNPTEEKIPFKDCTVDGVELAQYSSDEYGKKLKDAIDFTVCDSLTNASTLEDIIQKLGNPYRITCTLRNNNSKYKNSKIEVEYQQESSVYSYIHFTLSGDGNFITTVNYQSQ